MRRYILTLFLISVTVLPSLAQHYVGLKNAYSITGVSSTSFKTSTISSVFNPGVLYRYEHKQFGKFKFGIQAEFNLLNKGFMFDVDTARNTPEIKHTIQSIDIPITTQFIFILGPLRPYITVGVNVGYILSRKYEELGIKQNYEFTDIDRRTEYGIGGGAGLGFDLKRILITAEWRYNFNFSYLNKPIILGQRGSNYMNTTQMFISLNILYKFSKSKKD